MIDALGDYHLVQQIGTGGMGEIWLAVDARDGAIVAVKRMRPELAADGEQRRAFVDEATLGLRLHHPNIIQTLELGTAETGTASEVYLVLELLHGRPLVDVLRAAQRRSSPVPIAVVMRVIADVARGLDHAHQLRDADGVALGVVHRDVSPHNVFVCATGVAKIFDFGVAKARRQEHESAPGEIRGKLHYLAPELLRGQAPDARFDIFALGVVMHELLTGVPLFRGENDAETLHQLLTRHVPSPELVRGDVPPALGAIVLRALRRDRDRRLPSAAAMADAIEAVAETEGIAVTPSVVRGFVGALFPDDRALDAERIDSAKRVYAIVSAPITIAPQAIDPPASAPMATVPVEVMASAVLASRAQRRHSGFARAAMIVGVIGMAAFAAASAARFMATHSSLPPSTAGTGGAAPVRATVVAPSVVAELEGTSSLLRAPTDASPVPPRSGKAPAKKRARVNDGCSVYFSITKGAPTVVCPDATRKHSRR